MNTFLKLASYKENKNCNCISPFHIEDISGINPNTGVDYTNEDRDVIKTALYRISNSKGCQVGVCCDPKDPFSSIDQDFMNAFIKKYPKIQPVYNGTTLTSIKLSTTTDVTDSGWVDPTPYFVCKITKATIQPSDKATVLIATNLVVDCFSDSCNDTEKITLKNLLAGSKSEMLQYTYVDDARVAQSIREGNISYVKEFIRKYKQIDAPLTHDDYNNRLIHIAAESKNIEILNMLIALKANINIKNKNNETPMHLAIKAQNLKNIERLIAQGSDLTIQTNKGETPIFYAVKTGNIGLVRLLYNAGSVVLSVDKKGNNLIHYCILNTPTPTEKDGKSGNSQIYQSVKSEILRFLLENGVSSEQKNNDGKTPLELTKLLITKKTNKETGRNKKQSSNRIDCNDDDEDEDPTFTDQVREAFFNIIPIREAFTEKQNISTYSPEHLSLLQIQTMLFNNILRNNPDKYSKYINVSDIPAGAPIEVLDTVCVGPNVTGNEDSETCYENGGQLVKVKNKTTQVKLELISDEQSAIDSIKQKDLYFKKIAEKVPSETLPAIIANYNKSAQNIVVPQTTGMTYSIGDSSSNNISVATVPTLQQSISLEQTTQQASPQTTSPQTTSPQTTQQSSQPKFTEHPPVMVDGDLTLEKSKQEAIKNSTKLIQNPSSTNANIPQPTQSWSIQMVMFIKKYMWYFLSVIILILLILGVIAYKNIFSNENKSTNL
jgi:hypothetical protein